MLRQKRFEREEKEAMERYERETEAVAALPGSSAAATSAALRAQARAPATGFDPVPEPSPPLPGAPRRIKTVRTIAPTQAPMPEQPAERRAKNFEEVNLGYELEVAVSEADRCLGCKKPRCVPGCPVGIDIPGFVIAVAHRDLQKAYRILKDSNALPAVCGRVCPQESQCEANCIVGKKLEPVGIGRLERYVADFAADRGWDVEPATPKVGKKVAVVGAGPAGLACTGDLIKHGLDVTVFEALHVAGGVLKYGIPEFRLPDQIIDREVDALRQQGVQFELDTVIGKVFTIPQVLSEMGYSAVFIATGAGSPRFMNIPGEAYNGVFSANEFLTRVNLMRGYKQPLYDTPVGMGRRVAVIGAGNTAMDSARVALRIGAEEVTIVYRRSERESPARVEELHHAKDEGVNFRWLTNPVRILGNEAGWAVGMECVEMELGEPDDSGRRRPTPVSGTEQSLDVDTVICALGTTANPIIAQTTPGLDVNRWGYIDADEETGATSLPGVFAGGDIVTGAATVILAMGAGRKAAAGILGHLGIEQAPALVAAQEAD
ncbi:MAG: glutamate synthase (NADPH), homotetrameric [Acidobacteria bacterium]|nr:glutamate synthase (NADPH), homotetrameric [Acidobacteriota bacterium]